MWRGLSRFVLIFWGVLGGLILLGLLLFLLIAAGAFGPMPTFEELENPKSSLASEVLTDDHEPLGGFFIQNRSFVGRNELAPSLVDALVSTEDARFYSHSGIDAKGLMRVMFKTVMLGKDEAGGGSTITQQLAKNLFPRDTAYSDSKFVKFVKLGISKFKEWITAVKLERNYTKDEILTMYLNTVPFGSGAYGIKMASRTFFNTTPDSLRDEEAALLVGMVKGPTWYSPVRNPERALLRRNQVLGQRVKYGNLSQAACDSLSALPLGLDFMPQDHNSGLGTYFREHLRLVMTASEPVPTQYHSRDQYVADSTEWADNPLYGWCNKNRKPDGSPYNLYRDGLKIYSTIDATLQRYAEEAVAEHLGKTLQPAFDREKKNGIFGSEVKRKVRDLVIRTGIHQSERYRNMKAQGFSNEEIDKAFNTPVSTTLFSWNGDIDTVITPMDSMLYSKRQLRTGFMAMEPYTGRVKVWVGGPSFRHFKYDQVYSAMRQVGSTIKPFLYTLAMQEGYSPCLKVPNVPQVFDMGDTVWIPKNSNTTRHDGEMVTLRWGLANSVNNISAWLIKQFSPMAVAELIHKMGVNSYIDPVNSIFLGTSEVTVYEMVGAYNTFASGGVHIDPLLVTRIEDRNGNILATFQPRKREVISQKTAYLMVQLLRSVIDQGSGIRLRYVYNLRGPFGGKTGTTQNHSDGWFMSIYPTLVMGTWVGAEDPAVHFNWIAMGQGASMALPIQGLFLQKVMANPNLGISPSDTWRVPKGMEGIQFNCDDAPRTQEDEEGEEFF